MKLQAKNPQVKINKLLKAMDKTTDKRKFNRVMNIALKNNINLSIEPIYSFDQLSDKAKETAINKWRDGFDSIDLDIISHDLQTILGLMGFECEYNYSVSYSQGDGAAIYGDYSYKKVSLQSIKEYAPLDKDLHSICKDLQQLQSKNFYQLSADIKTNNWGNSSYIANLYKKGDYCENLETEKAMQTIIDNLNQWIYERLLNEYEYQNSDECIIETIEANDYKFDVNGKFK